jgi:hypothetical protein
MKVKILYYELKEKEFRSEKTLRKFLKNKLPSEILNACEYKNKIIFNLEIRRFLEKYMGQY